MTEAVRESCCKVSAYLHSQATAIFIIMPGSLQALWSTPPYSSVNNSRLPRLHLTFRQQDRGPCHGAQTKGRSIAVGTEWNKLISSWLPFRSRDCFLVGVSWIVRSICVLMWPCARASVCLCVCVCLNWLLYHTQVWLLEMCFCWCVCFCMCVCFVFLRENQFTVLLKQGLSSILAMEYFPPLKSNYLRQMNIKILSNWRTWWLHKNE